MSFTVVSRILKSSASPRWHRVSGMWLSRFSTEQGARAHLAEAISKYRDMGCKVVIEVPGRRWKVTTPYGITSELSLDIPAS